MRAGHVLVLGLQAVKDFVRRDPRATGEAGDDRRPQGIQFQVGLLLLIFQQAQASPHDFAGIVEAAGFHLLTDEVLEVRAQGNACRHDQTPGSC